MQHKGSMHAQLSSLLALPPPHSTPTHEHLSDVRPKHSADASQLIGPVPRLWRRIRPEHVARHQLRHRVVGIGIRPALCCSTQLGQPTRAHHHRLCGQHSAACAAWASCCWHARMPASSGAAHASAPGAAACALRLLLFFLLAAGAGARKRPPWRTSVLPATSAARGSAANRLVRSLYAPCGSSSHALGCRRAHACTRGPGSGATRAAPLFLSACGLHTSATSSAAHLCCCAVLGLQLSGKACTWYTYACEFFLVNFFL